MQASNGETKGLGGTAGRGRPSWEKAVAGDWATLMLACGGFRREEVTHVEACDTLVVVGVAVGV